MRLLLAELKKLFDWLDWSRIIIIVLLFLLTKLIFSAVFGFHAVCQVILQVFFYCAGIVSGIGLTLSLDRRKRRQRRSWNGRS